MRNVIPQGKLWNELKLRLVHSSIVPLCKSDLSLRTFCARADVNYALANLHSYANDASGQANNETQTLEEENLVLLEDDLVDDDDW